MGTTCKFLNGFQRFTGTPQFISAGGLITSNQQVANDGTETAIFTETVYANTLATAGDSFKVEITGEISSEGTGDCTFTLRYGTTDILAVPTVSLVDEDDKPFMLQFWGRVHTTGASGKIVAHGHLYVYQGTPLQWLVDTANTGATVDLTADGSLNVTADWDVASTDCDVIVTNSWFDLKA